MPQAGNNGFGDGVRRNDGITPAIGFPGAQLGSMDLAIDDYVNDLDSLGMKFTRQSLAEHAQDGFADGQRREAGLPRRGAGQHNETMSAESISEIAAWAINTAPMTMASAKPPRP